MPNYVYSKIHLPASPETQYALQCAFLSVGTKEAPPLFTPLSGTVYISPQDPDERRHRPLQTALLNDPMGLSKEGRSLTLNFASPIPTVLLHATAGSEADYGLALLLGDWRQTIRTAKERVHAQWNKSPPEQKEAQLTLLSTVVDRQSAVNAMEQIEPGWVKEGLKQIKNQQDFGYPDWYKWSIANWGTKWDITDSGDWNKGTASFETAWSPPSPAFAALTERTQTPVLFSGIDEGGSFSGVWAMLPTPNGAVEVEIFDGDGRKAGISKAFNSAKTALSYWITHKDTYCTDANTGAEIQEKFYDLFKKVEANPKAFKVKLTSTTAGTKILKALSSEKKISSKDLATFTNANASQTSSNTAQIVPFLANELLFWGAAKQSKDMGVLLENLATLTAAGLIDPFKEVPVPFNTWGENIPSIARLASHTSCLPLITWIHEQLLATDPQKALVYAASAMGDALRNNSPVVVDALVPLYNSSQWAEHFTGISKSTLECACQLAPESFMAFLRKQDLALAPFKNLSAILHTECTKIIADPSEVAPVYMSRVPTLSLIKDELFTQQEKFAIENEINAIPDPKAPRKSAL